MVLPPRSKTLREKIRDKIEEIKADPLQLHDVKMKAEEEKISMDSALVQEAKAKL